jgi:ABC-2 type transport system ATP-binding protein
MSAPTQRAAIDAAPAHDTTVEDTPASVAPAGEACRAHGAAPELLVRFGALRRGRRRVLGAGELRLPLGASVALVGANGAGKTTLLMAVAGVLTPRGGRATVEGPAGPLRTTGYVPQRPAFPAWLPLREVLRLHDAPTAALDVLGPPAAQDALLARRAGELSGGQTQALAAAIVLHRRDPLVLLDEPFAGVDLARRTALQTLVAERRRRQPATVIVLSSHVAADLDALCDWVVVLRARRCVFAGPRNALGTAGTFAARLAALTG